MRYLEYIEQPRDEELPDSCEAPLVPNGNVRRRNPRSRREQGKRRVEQLTSFREMLSTRVQPLVEGSILRTHDGGAAAEEVDDDGVEAWWPKWLDYWRGRGIQAPGNVHLQEALGEVWRGAPPYNYVADDVLWAQKLVEQTLPALEEQERELTLGELLALF